jgi:hypothetical protein
VYVIVPEDNVLIEAGLHVPVIDGLLSELLGRDGAIEFWHNGPIWIKVGITDVVTSISIVVVAAHCPASGVKVYVVVPVEFVFIVAGFQTPEIAGMLSELFGRAGAIELRHKGPIWVNVGVIDVVTTISIVIGVAHCPAEGVKV